MWVDEEGVEKKLDMGMKLAVEAEPGKPVEEDPFAKVPTSMATYRNFEVRNLNEEHPFTMNKPISWRRPFCQSLNLNFP